MNTNIPQLSVLLKDKLEERCKRNASYSLRAFARDLKVPASRVSRWLKGQDGLSETSARKLAQKLGLSYEETETFVAAMEAKFSRAKVDRLKASARLKILLNQYRPLNVDAFKVISDWYNLAVLSLVETTSFKTDFNWIAKRLSISVIQAKGALERLKKLEMVAETQTGNLKPTGVFFANPGGIPSKSIRSFHTQIITKALDAIELQTLEERDFSSLVLAVNPADLGEAKLAIKKFRDEFEDKFCTTETQKEEVYALGIQFFKLTASTKITGENYEN